MQDLDQIQQRSFKIGVVGLALCIIWAFFNPGQFFHSYLLAYMFWIGIALGSFALLMVQYLSGGVWGLVIRRLLEAATRTFPLLVLLFLPLVLGLRYLYPWARPEEVVKDVILQHKSVYLNIPFFLVRAALYFVAWLSVSHFLNKWSLEQDQMADHRLPEHVEYAKLRRFRLLSGPGLVIYGLTVTFASIDWVMSLEPHWLSTIFGIMFMGGQGISALSFAIVVAVLLTDRTESGVPDPLYARPLRYVISPTHFHDLGKLLLAFVMLWAYFAFSQFLIIWSGNLPEETPWYLRRMEGGWKWIGLFVILFHFALPFLLLLSRPIKRNRRVLAIIAVWMLLMRLVDLFWMIAPAAQMETGVVSYLHVHVMDILAPIGVGGVWLAQFIQQLKSRPLLPLYDPYLEEAFSSTGSKH
ncbi:MAG TPA: hypothetical protein VNM22_06090 [Candidatus Limnocylindrales bacterium]|nr:hypothetical protein [Candidatus Limnocylindrales bacterium]